MRLYPCVIPIFFVACTAGATSQEDPSLTESIRKMWQDEQYQLAKTTLQPLIQKDDENPQYLALMGQTEAFLGNLDDAEDLLEEAVDINPKQPDYQFWYGSVSCNAATSANMFSALSYAKQCRKAYEAALSLAPEEPKHYVALGQFYAQAPGIAGGDKDKARQLAQTLKGMDELQGWLLELQTAEFSDDQAFNDFIDAAPALKNRPEPYFARAMQLLGQDKPQDAFTYLSKATLGESVDEGSHETQLSAHYQIGRLAVVSESHVEEGIASLNAFISRSDDERRIQWANVRLAQLFALQGETDKAKALVTPILAKTEDDDLKAHIKKLL